MPGRLDAKRASRILGPPSGYRKWRGHPLVRAFDERATAALKDSDRALKRAAGVARIGHRARWWCSPARRCG